MKQNQYILILLTVLMISIGKGNQVKAIRSRPVNDTDKLNMAIEYFQSGKYHEALLLFNQLDQEYNLNTRYRAYIGVCYYHEWEYDKASLYLDSVISKLSVFAPHEQAVYYYTNAESHFNLKEYKEAIPCYEQMLNVCYDNEKGDVFYRLGFCYMFENDWNNAHGYFNSALSYYQRFGFQSKIKPRLAQIQNMIKGCKEHIEIVTDSVIMSDSTILIVTKEQ